MVLSDDTLVGGKERGRKSILKCGGWISFDCRQVIAENLQI